MIEAGEVDLPAIRDSEVMVNDDGNEAEVEDHDNGVMRPTTKLDETQEEKA